MMMVMVVMKEEDRVAKCQNFYTEQIFQPKFSTDILCVTFCNSGEGIKKRRIEKIFFPGVGLSLIGTSGPLSTMPTSQRCQVLLQISAFEQTTVFVNLPPW